MAMVLVMWIHGCRLFLEGNVLNDEDCDDTLASRNPNGVEVCDDLDNDCDVDVDEEAVDQQTFYLDNDADTFGDADTTIHSCILPEGYVENALDCNDESDTTSPNGIEECDGLDNDCDEEIDESMLRQVQYIIETMITMNMATQKYR